LKQGSSAEFVGENREPVDDSGVRFGRHGKANEWGGMESSPGALRHQGVRVIHPPWSGYPLSGCSPAEPGSVSPDKYQYSEVEASENRCIL
jgi:hypothetical protein